MLVNKELQSESGLLCTNAIRELYSSDLQHEQLGQASSCVISSSKRIFDAHLVEVNNRLAVIPKPIGFVIGEQIIRPTLDFLSVFGEKTGLIFSVAVEKINYLSSCLPNPIPVAEAHELTVGEIGNIVKCEKNINEQTKLNISENNANLILLSGQYTEKYLIEAVKNSKLEDIRNFSYEKIFSTRDSDGNTLLHIAIIAKSQIEILEELATFINLDMKNSESLTPINLAIIENNVEALKWLLSRDTNLAITQEHLIQREREPVNSLALAVSVENVEAIDIIVKICGEDVLRPTYAFGNILHVAIFENKYESLRKLTSFKKEKLENIINSDCGQQTNMTPLGLASFLGRGSFIELLINAGADITFQQSATGQTAMHLAVKNANVDAIRLLYEYYPRKILFDIHDHKGITPHDIAKNGPKHIKTLVENFQKGIVSSTQEFKSKRPKNLTFAGGGSKAIAYGGVVEELDAQNIIDGVERVAGTSGGAILASLIAIGLEPEKIRMEIDSADFLDFLDYPNKEQSIKSSFIFFYNKFLKLFSFNGGISNGERFRDWIESIIQKKTGLEFLTLGELKNLATSNKSFKHLHIFCSDLINQKIAHFSSENDEQEDYIISDLVQMSMSIPGVFEPHEIHVKRFVEGKPTRMNSNMSYTDGGLLQNNPVEAFDEGYYVGLEDERALAPMFNPETIGFVFSVPDDQANNKMKRGMFSFVSEPFSFYYNAEWVYENSKPKIDHRVCKINTAPIHTMSLGITEDEKHRVIELAKKATRKCLDLSSTEFFYKVVLPEKDNLPKINLEKLQNKAISRILTEEIHSKSCLKGSLSNSYKVLIQGKSGSGKSESCLTFGENYRDDFSLIWQIDGQNAISIYYGFNRLAEMFGIYTDEDSVDELIQKVYKKLSEHSSSKPWLLILKNMSAYPAVPEKGGLILITSENDLWNPKLNKKILVDVLMKSSSICNYSGFEDQYQDVPKELKANPVGFDLYKKFLTVSGNESSTPTMFFPNSKVIDKPVKAVVQLGVSYLKNKYPNAVDEINLLGFLSTTHLPKIIFQQVCGGFFEQFFEELKNLGLLEYSNSGQNFINLKREFIKVILEEINKEDQVVYLKKIAPIIDKSYGKKSLEFGIIQFCLGLNLKKMEKDQEAKQHIEIANTILNPPYSSAEINYLISITEQYFTPDLMQLIINTHPLNTIVETLKDKKTNVNKPEYFPSELGKTVEAAQEHMSIGAALSTEIRYEEAIIHFVEAKKIYESLEGFSSVNAGKAIKNIGFVRHHQGKHSEALDCFNDALDIFIKEYGKVHFETASTYENVATELGWLKDYKEAIKNFESANTIYSNDTQAFPIKIAYNLYRIGQCHLKSENYLVAISTLQDALKETENACGLDSLSVAVVMREIAVAKSGIGSYEESLDILQKVKNIYSKIEGPQSLKVADVIETIGRIYLKLDMSTKAIINLYESLQICKDNNITPEVHTAEIHSLIASQLSILGNYKEAISELQEEEKIYSKIKEVSLLKIANCAYCTGSALIQLSDYTAGLNKFEESRMLCSRVNSTESIEIEVDVINNVSTTYFNLRNFTEAANHLVEVLEIYKQNFEKYWLEKADCHATLALCFCYQNKPQKAITHLRDALCIYSEKIGAESPEVLNITIDIANLLLTERRKQEAYNLLSEIAPTVKKISSPFETARFYIIFSQAVCDNKNRLIYLLKGKEIYAQMKEAEYENHLEIEKDISKLNNIYPNISSSNAPTE